MILEHIKYRLLIPFLFLCVVLIINTCKLKVKKVETYYETRNVIVLIIDGARYSEMWDAEGIVNIPYMETELASLGVVNHQFFNDGPTYTLAGHTAVSTGYYQQINNAGRELPMYPSFFQYFNEKIHSNDSSFIVASKHKIEVLKNCSMIRWKDKFTPISDCGTSGLGSANRADSITFDSLYSVLELNSARLLLASFREPDSYGHAGNWDEYIKSIKKSDEYVYRVWQYIQSSPFYKDKTTLFVTNDHGRHLDTVANGFISHGDKCEGCRHINLLAIGPDFKNGELVFEKRQLIDITATIAELLRFYMPYSQGEVMHELFK